MRHPDFAIVYSSLVLLFLPLFHLFQDLHQTSMTGRPNRKMWAWSERGLILKQVPSHVNCMHKCYKLNANHPSHIRKMVISTYLNAIRMELAIIELDMICDQSYRFNSCLTTMFSFIYKQRSYRFTT